VRSAYFVNWLTPAHESVFVSLILVSMRRWLLCEMLCSSGKNGDRKDMNGSTAMTGHCQTGTDGIQACLWTPGAKGQAAHKIVF